jgi:putative tryptophan/tyrosine transport system substrate-binding protein
MKARAAFGILLCLALSAGAQTKPARVGVLELGTPDSFPLRTAAFQAGMRDSGYVEGRDVVLEYRWARGRIEDLPRLGAELVGLGVEVIFAPSTATALAARRATAKTPIVFAVAADPVGVGLVRSLSRPGGNATGLTTINIEVIPKRLEILKALSGAVEVGVLFNPEDASNVLAARIAEEAAPKMGITAHPLPAVRPADLGPAFASLGERGIGALFVSAGAMMDGNRRRIVALAARSRIPSVYGAREFVDAGGLVSYSASFTDNYRRAAGYVDRILKGAKPADLAVEQASRFELVINMKTARALGLAIPPELLLSASEVIE